MRFLLLLIFLSGWYFAKAQHQEKVDFVRGEISITPIPETQSINGLVTYDFRALQDVDSVFLDAKGMDFSSVLLNGRTIRYTNTGKRISISKNFKTGRTYQLQLNYSCTPEQTVYFVGLDDATSRGGPAAETGPGQTDKATEAGKRTASAGRQIWTQGQGKYTSHWLPSFDAMEEKVEFDLSIVFDSNYDVIANGKLESDKTNNSGNKNFEGKTASSHKTTPNEKTTWNFDMQHPMSSYLLAFAIGDYEAQELTSKSGIPIKNHYYPRDSLRVEPTYRYTTRIFDFLESEIGVDYPWQNYKQIPVHNFLYAGMENTGTTIFSDAYVIDSTAFVDKNYVNVNAHELAHQWFGNLVTEKSADHHWLHEGFATYYAYLVEKELFGDDHFYWKLYNSLQRLKASVDSGGGQRLVDPEASSLTFYEKGAWALFMLRERLGDADFKRGIKNYLDAFRFKNVTVSDFLRQMEKASGEHLSGFEEEWLTDTDIPLAKATDVLSRRSPSLRLLFEMDADIQRSESDKIDYGHYWAGSPSIHLKKYILEKYSGELPDELIAQAFASDTVPVRQALSAADDIERYPKEAFESLLGDSSYVTIENTLFKLWQAYPDDRNKYLDRTAHIEGLPNKNVRLLWLTLAMLTEEYRSGDTKRYFDELSMYTDSQYSTAVRQGAFFYLKEAFGLTDQSFTNLIRATNHHAWQFRKFARDLLDGLLKDPDYKKRIENIAKELNPQDLRYLSRKFEN